MQPITPQLKFNGQRLRQLASALHTHMARCGYELIDTPIIQSADLFLTKAGDQIVNRLFTFERRGKQLALRPEFTATAAHDYVTCFANDPPIARWQFSGAIFEDDPDRIGLDYQHYSIGAELIGLAGAIAEAEIIGIAAQGVMNQGIENWQLIIGHVGLMRLLLARFKLDSRTLRFLLSYLPALKDPALSKAYIIEQLDKLSLTREPDMETIFSDIADNADAALNTQQILDVLLDATQRGAAMGGRTRHDIVRRLLQKRQRASERQQILDALDFLENWGQISAAPVDAFLTIRNFLTPDDTTAQITLTEWVAVISLLDAYGIPAERIRIQPDLARSWDYYTGIVFELWADDLHLGGGGRYDELARLVGGTRDVPAVGFAYYADQWLAALPQNSAHVESPVTIAVTDATHADGIRWAQALRQRDVAAVLTPIDRLAASTGRVLTVEPDGDLRSGSNRYALSQINDLLANLKRA